MTDINSAALEKWLGCILGGAIGDAIGRPAEFSARSVLRSTILFGGDPQPIPILRPLEKLQDGSFTDDTFIAITHLRVFKDERFARDQSAQFVQRSLVNWLKGNVTDAKVEWQTKMGKDLKLDRSELDEYYMRGAGTTAQAAKHYATKEPHLAPNPYTLSCGPLTRLPVFFLTQGAENLKSNEIADCVRQTHTRTEVFLAAAVLWRLLIPAYAKRQLDFAAIELAIEQGISAWKPLCQDTNTGQIEDQFRSRWKRLREFLEHGDIEYVLGFGGTSDAWDVLFTTLGILSLTKGNFEDTAEIVKHLGGDSDSTGFLACGVAGLLKGIKAIPRKFIAYIDSAAGQPNSKQISAIVQAAFNQLESTPSPITEGEEDEKALVSEVEGIRKLLGFTGGNSEESHFVPHGYIITSPTFRSSFLKILKRLGNDDHIIISDTGTIRICAEAMSRHPVCISSFLSQSPAMIADGDSATLFNQKRSVVVDVIKHRLDSSTDNEARRLANLLVTIGTTEAKNLLSSNKFASFRDAIAWNEHCSDALQVAYYLREPTRVPEHNYRNSAIILYRLRSGTLDHNQEFVKNGFRIQLSTLPEDSTKAVRHSNPVPEKKSLNLHLFDPRWKQIAGSAGEGGIFAVGVTSDDIKRAGPLRLKSNEIAWPTNPATSYPLPAGQLALAKACQQDERLAVIIMPRRNALIAVGQIIGQPIRFITRQSAQPKSLSSNELGQLTKRLQREWERACNLAPSVEPIVLFKAVSLVMEMVLNSDHGCSIAILENQTLAKRIKEDSQKFTSITLEELKIESDVRAFCELLEVDGGVLCTSDPPQLLRHGVTFEAGNLGIDSLAYPVRTWLESTRRGKRHESSAVYAKRLSGKGLVVVGSQRGDVTVFGEKDLVHLMPAI